MCGRYATFTRLDEQPGLFDLDLITEPVLTRPPSWNVAPTTAVPVIVERYDGGLSREAHVAHWGLIPPWAKDRAIGSRMINARAETVAEKRSFAPSLKKRRCLVPADGYYEWKKVGSAKQPYFISRADGLPLAFAGLYSWWKDADGWLLSTTIITKEADQFSDIHDRIPVILDQADFSAWLDPRSEDVDEMLAILAHPTPDLSAIPVAKDVGRVSVDRPENIEKIPDDRVIG
ncbi:SOS response-associated peptidase [Flaviflexus huanghaiensis]|uniref:SOS response-associated peptidase n=1 Tax=Flaviflexus huanghaiensis TaxID=1111473 RepID=UPI0015F8D7F0|nr:SOS response-associated peptidase [Flaviflexus huanghaiensis]